MQGLEEIEKHDDDKVVLHPHAESSQVLEKLEDSRVVPDMRSSTPFGSNHDNLGLNDLETQSYASGPADSEGFLSDEAEEHYKDIGVKMWDKAVDDVVLVKDVASGKESEEKVGEETIAQSFLNHLLSESLDPSEDHIHINKIGPWLPTSKRNRKVYDPFAGKGPIEQFGPNRKC